MGTMKQKLNPAGPRDNNPPQATSAFSLTDLLVVTGSLILLLLIFVPGLARGDHYGAGFQCLNNHRQLAAAWRQWSADNQDYLLTCQGTTAGPLFDPKLRPNWMPANLTYDGNTSSNYDPAEDIVKCPIWPYARSADLFRCPADTSTVALGTAWNGYPTGTHVRRVRSYSMSQVFSRGEWLDGTGSNSSPPWRTYQKGAEIVIPAKTFLLLDENPGSLNDAAFASACSFNQPTDPPTGAKVIDIPGNWHNGGPRSPFQMATWKFINGAVPIFVICGTMTATTRCLISRLVPWILWGIWMPAGSQRERRWRSSSDRTCGNPVR